MEAQKPSDLALCTDSEPRASVYQKELRSEIQDYEAKTISNKNNTRNLQENVMKRTDWDPPGVVARQELPFLKEISNLKERLTAREDSEDSLEEPVIKWCIPFIHNSTEIMMDSLEVGNQHMDFSDEEVDDNEEDDGGGDGVEEGDNAESDQDDSEEDIEEEAVQMCERYLPPTDLFMDTIVEVSEDNEDTNDELEEMHAVIDINVGYSHKKARHGGGRSGPIYLADTDDFAIDLNNIDQGMPVESIHNQADCHEDIQTVRPHIESVPLTSRSESTKGGGLFLPGPVASSPRQAPTPNPLPKPPRSWPLPSNPTEASRTSKRQRIPVVEEGDPPPDFENSYQEFKEIEEMEMMSRNRAAIDTILRSKKANKRGPEPASHGGQKAVKSTLEEPEADGGGPETTYCVRNMAQFWEAFCLRVQQEAEVLAASPTPHTIISASSSSAMSTRKKWKSMPDLEEKKNDETDRGQISSHISREDLSLTEDAATQVNRPVVKSDEVIDDLEVCKTVSIRERCQLFEHLAARASSEVAGGRLLASDRRQWSSMPSLKSPAAAGSRRNNNNRRQLWENSSLRPAGRPDSLHFRHVERPATSCGVHIRPMSPVNRDGSGNTW